MKKILLKTLFIIFPLAVVSQNAMEISIIPEPVSMDRGQGYFVLPKEIALVRPEGVENDFTVSFLKEKIGKATGSLVKVSNSHQGDIKLLLNRIKKPILGNEGYTLSVNAKHIHISANTPTGLFYGAQSLIQLFPPEIESKTMISNVNWQIPTVEIIDYPRVEWRGLMLDVSRHFFTVDEVKRFIDQMSRYKFNRFHFGLTNDEGWRIEIKALPKLTEIGAWRTEKVGNFGTFSKPLPDEPKNYGGYYTHEQIHDLVKYAGDRFIEIMPEINGPGHSLAAIASYPELASTPDAKNYSVRAGEPIIDWSVKPRHISYIDNNLSPANEVVYEFLDKVITEVAQLFPFEYIHAGGDETTYNFWEKSPEIAVLMEKEKLKNMAEVQSYFGKRYEKIILSKGKKMMGWDEILEGRITPTTGLMSWRGIKHGIEASKSGHYVVMSPTTFAYIDYMQGDISTEAPVYASLRLNKTYEFNPVPEGANAKYILGGQANLWTEQIYNYRQAEYMTWPRGFAISESVWSPENKKDWSNFVRKTENHFKRYDFAEVKYSPAMYDPIVNVRKEGETYYVELTPEISGLDIYTSFDNSTPDYFYPKYTTPLPIPTDARLMRIVTYKGKIKTGRVMTITVEDLKNRANLPGK